MEDRNLRRSISLKFYNILLDTGLLAKLYGLLMQLYAFFWWSNGNSGFFREKSVLLSGVFISMDSAHRCTLVPYSTLPFLAWSLFALNLIWSGRKKPMFIHWKRQTHFCWMNEWGSTFPLTSIDLYVAEKENYKNSAKVRWDYFSNINESFFIQEGMELSLVITKTHNFRWRCSLASLNASRYCGKRLSPLYLKISYFWSIFACWLPFKDKKFQSFHCHEVWTQNCDIYKTEYRIPVRELSKVSSIYVTKNS